MMAAASSLVRALAALLLAGSVAGHSYHLGGCPSVDPMPDFDMSRFLGRWYVVQKTSTGSRCLVNQYSRGLGERNYTLEQDSEHFLLGLTSVDHVYRYTGLLTAPAASSPAAMRVRFPLSVAGSASYTVFMTDYENYAGVFTCQKMTFAHRQSASILSRRPTLSKVIVDKIRNRLSSYNVDPYDLSIINQTECHLNTTDGYDININPNTLTAGSVASVVRKAGEKIGDGIEVVADGATRLYHHVRGDGDDATSHGRDREELSDAPGGYEAEWLP
ncbi:apolipoprotein D-like [Bacillus rossius redtenbacheri]|uniref:apolipoprotein D-like n=1 Tax=Bacillus rossius redtenbacheri TaxID=93214 RepID=UPI002FDE5F04